MSSTAPIDITAATIVIGGAGLLGTRIVDTLLRNPDRGMVIVLSRNPKTLEHNLHAVYGSRRGTEIFSDPRLKLISADLGDPEFTKIISAEMTALSDGRTLPVAAIYNLAAQVDAFASRQKLAPINAAGTKTAIRLANHPSCKNAHIVHASTLSIFASADGSDETCEDWLPADSQAFIRGGYAQTKAIAESHIAEHIAAGGTACSIRLGLLVPDKLQPIDPGSFITMFINGITQTGSLPDESEEAFVDMTPLDQAARAMVQAGDLGIIGVVNYACEETLSLTQAISVIADHKPLTLAPKSEWLEALKALPSLSAAILEAAFDKSGFLIRRCQKLPLLNADLFQSTGRRWSIERAQKIGIEPPRNALETFKIIVEKTLPVNSTALDEKR